MLPVDYDDVPQAVAKFLLYVPEIADVLGYDDQGPWVFQGTNLVNIEGKSSLLGDRATSVVINQRGSWTAPNLHNNMRFPRISIDIYADPIRDASRNIADSAEGGRRISYVHRVVDSYLHRPYGFDESWGFLRVTASVRQDELTMYPVGDGDGLLRGLSYYALTTG